jgi:hypothetical protein
MQEQIIYVDKSEIRAGKLANLRAAIKELVDFVDMNETWQFAYGVYISEDGRQMTVVQVQPDSDALERHMEIAGPAFRPFINLINLKTIDIYGQPSHTLLARLREKAAMLGGGEVTVHSFQAGFTRLSVEQSEPVS